MLFNFKLGILTLKRMLEHEAGFVIGDLTIFYDTSETEKIDFEVFDKERTKRKMLKVEGDLTSIMKTFVYMAKSQYPGDVVKFTGHITGENNDITGEVTVRENGETKTHKFDKL